LPKLVPAEEATGMRPVTAAYEKKLESIEQLPSAIAQSQDALKLLERMVGDPTKGVKPHPGFESYVGATLAPGAKYIPGTAARDFKGMEEQITGGAFLEAFNTLKGGGQITEKEGEKATQAITRINSGLSESEYRRAVDDLREILNRGIQRAESKIGKAKPGTAPASTSTPAKTVVKTGTYNGRKVVQYSDGSVSYAD